MTSPGPAAIAVIRLCGPAVPPFLQRHVLTRRAFEEQVWRTGDVWRAELVDGGGFRLDDLLVSVHAPPPQWDIRLHLHGSPWLIRRCRELLVAGGFEETCPAATTLWQIGDAIEAEAWALLPQTVTLRGARWLLGQVDRLRAALRQVLEETGLEDGRRLCSEIAARGGVIEWFSRPARIALVGPPNSGKSTLANALADQAVSLVSPTPGTTRDWVEIPGQVRGFPVIWLDTAGLRKSEDAVEVVSVERTRELMRAADAIVVMLDATANVPGAFPEVYGELQPACVALNKVDLPASSEAVAESLPESRRTRVAMISAAKRIGLDGLMERVLSGLKRDEGVLAEPAAFTPRQVSALEIAAAATDKVALSKAVCICLEGPANTGT